MKKFLAVAFSLTMFFGLKNHTEAFAEETYDDMAHLEEECGLVGQTNQKKFARTQGGASSRSGDLVRLRFH